MALNEKFARIYGRVIFEHIWIASSSADTRKIKIFVRDNSIRRRIFRDALKPRLKLYVIYYLLSCIVQEVMELSFAVLTGKNRLWILQLLLRPYQRTTKKCLWPLFLVSFIALLLSWTSSAEKNWPPKTETGILLFSDFFHRGGMGRISNFSSLFLFVSSVTRERAHHGSLRPFVEEKRHDKIWSSFDQPTTKNLSSSSRLLYRRELIIVTIVPFFVHVLFDTLCSITDEKRFPTVG